MLNHGGNLTLAHKLYPDAPKPWVDLSTGVSPWSWPVPELPADVWQRLPESPEALCRAAARYYHCDQQCLVAMAGSQAAIELIPRLLPLGTVALPQWGYAEHRKNWDKAAHDCRYYTSVEQLDAWVRAGKCDYVVVINPNNPTAETVSEHRLALWQQTLRARQGYLLVDEAFSRGHTSASRVPEGGLIVLKSLGKYFGLAGIRLGFALVPPALKLTLTAELLHWGLSSPAMWIGERALLDETWQQRQDHRLSSASTLLQTLLQPLFKAESLHATALFVSVLGCPDRLQRVFQAFSAQGIWLRYFQAQQQLSYLRFGLVHQDQLPRVKRVIASLLEQKL